MPENSGAKFLWFATCLPFLSKGPASDKSPSGRSGENRKPALPAGSELFSGNEAPDGTYLLPAIPPDSLPARPLRFAGIVQSCGMRFLTIPTAPPRCSLPAPDLDKKLWEEPGAACREKYSSRNNTDARPGTEKNMTTFPCKTSHCMRYTHPMSEKETFLTGIQSKVGRGLKDVKFFPANMFDASEEEVYKELNRLDAARDLPDPDVLGRYSPKCALA